MWVPLCARGTRNCPPLSLRPPRNVASRGHAYNTRTMDFETVYQSECLRFFFLLPSLECFPPVVRARLVVDTFADRCVIECLGFPGWSVRARPASYCANVASKLTRSRTDYRVSRYFLQSSKVEQVRLQKQLRGGDEIYAAWREGGKKKTPVVHRFTFVPASIARTLVYLGNETPSRLWATGRRRGGKRGSATVRCVIMPYLADLINPCA